MRPGVCGDEACGNRPDRSDPLGLPAKSPQAVLSRLEPYGLPGAGMNQCSSPLNIVKTAETKRLFPITRNALWRAVSRGCLRAFPHPTISAIKPKDRTKEQKAELKGLAMRAHEWHPNQLGAISFRHDGAGRPRGQKGLCKFCLGHSHINTTEIYAEKNGVLGQNRRAADWVILVF